MAGFGLIPIKSEGKFIHPDHAGKYYETATDEEYFEQLEKYAGWRGIDNTKNEQCLRAHLLKRL